MIRKVIEINIALQNSIFIQEEQCTDIYKSLINRVCFNFFLKKNNEDDSISSLIKFYIVGPSNLTEIRINVEHNTTVTCEVVHDAYRKRCIETLISWCIGAI